MRIEKDPLIMKTEIYKIEVLREYSEDGEGEEQLREIWVVWDFVNALLLDVNFLSPPC